MKIYGKTKQTYAPMWHIIKNDGRALCKPSLKIVEQVERDPGRVCNHCSQSAQLKRNQRHLFPLWLDGDGI